MTNNDMEHGHFWNAIKPTAKLTWHLKNSCNTDLQNYNFFSVSRRFWQQICSIMSKFRDSLTQKYWKCWYWLYLMPYCTFVKILLNILTSRKVRTFFFRTHFYLPRSEFFCWDMEVWIFDFCVHLTFFWNMVSYIFKYLKQYSKYKTPLDC